MAPEVLVTIASFSEVLQAHLAKTKLESEGIECFLINESSTWLYPNALGGVQLQVYESDRDRALEILASQDTLLRSV